LRLTPEEQMVEGKKLKLLGVYSLIEIEPIQFINTKSKGIVGSAYFGLVRTWDSFKKTLDGFYKIVTNQVSFKAVGGVFTIGKVANDSFKISFSYFLQLMALISINLGVINLFPMLPLDGGHIMFIFLELINRGPVSRRKMEIAQQIGLSILLMLMVGSIFNDVSRFF
jgi:regulator of sigma E protease